MITSIVMILEQMTFSKIYHLYELKRQVKLIENLFYPNNLMAQLPHSKVASSPGHTETELSHETNIYQQYKNRIEYNL